MRTAITATTMITPTRIKVIITATSAITITSIPIRTRIAV